MKKLVGLSTAGNLTKNCQNHPENLSVFDRYCLLGPQDKLARAQRNVPQSSGSDRKGRTVLYFGIAVYILHKIRNF